MSSITELHNKFQAINSLQLLSYIAKFCKDNGIHINITKAQKLMYCCYGVVLAKFGTRLVDEQPEAWQYGPVFPSALHSAQFFGLDEFIDGKTDDMDALPGDVHNLIDDALRHFGQYTALQLSNWTHLSGSPWSKASCAGTLLRVPLNDSDIKEYFLVRVLR